MLSSTLMGAAILAVGLFGPGLGPAGTVLAMLAGAGVYAIAIVSLRTFSREELGFFIDLLRVAAAGVRERHRA